MPFLLEKTKLLSKKIRDNQVIGNFTNFLADQADGQDTSLVKRVIDSNLTLGEKKKGGFLSNLWGLASQVSGFIGKFLNFTAISLVKIVGWLRAASIFIVNFDWNQTDAQLQKLIDNRSVSLTSAWGGLVGQVTGSLVAIGIGYGVSLLIPVIGNQMARSIAVAVLQEQGEALLDNFMDVLRETAYFYAQVAAIKCFTAIRRLAKKLFPNTFKNWGNGEPWRISDKFEEKLDTISSERLRAFTEEFVEEGFESFFDTAFIYARHLDDAIEQAKITKEEILGDTIKARLALTFDSDGNGKPDLSQETGEQRAYPEMPANLLKQQILNDISILRFVRDRDIGFFTGEKIQEEGRKFNFLRTAKVIFRGTPTPPWKEANGDYSILSTINLKDLKQGLKWKDFKRALKPYTWGNIWVWATLNKSRHEIGIYCNDENAGKAYIENLIDELIDDKPIAFDSRKELERNKYVRKDTKSQLVYPAYFTVTIKEPITSRDDATHDLSGKSFYKNMRKIMLWTSDEPPLPPDVPQGGSLT